MNHCLPTQRGHYHFGERGHDHVGATNKGRQLTGNHARGRTISMGSIKSKTEKQKKSFEKDYKKIMKDFQTQYAPIIQVPQWIRPGDFIIKFSLYQEMPNSVTSTDTLVNI